MTERLNGEQLNGERLHGGERRDGDRNGPAGSRGAFRDASGDGLAALRGRTVLLTGHTGFKGAWMALWLHALGARVIGVALPPESDDDVFVAGRLAETLDHRVANIDDPRALDAALEGAGPDLLVHMAAQALVRPSFDDPAGTLLTNVVGTAHVLDAARRMPSLRAAIVVTSDKCYENDGGPWGFRESDPMGGSDPYSASKGCAELVTASYRRSFFAPRGVPLASVRAGNVFGGGDWSADRLFPDIARAARARAEVAIRNPGHVRPWQHVLEPVRGYLMLAARMLDDPDPAAWAEGWNFGPDPADAVSVGTLAAMVGERWGAGAPSFALAARAPGEGGAGEGGANQGGAGDSKPEAGTLRLDSSKARQRLGWRPRLSLDEAVAMTVDWYAAQAEGGDMRAISLGQIERVADRTSDPLAAAA